MAVSVDTYKPQVMQAVLDLGADIINDVWGLRQPGAQDVVAAHHSCGVCLMHMHQTPQNMHLQHMQGDAVPQVCDFLLRETQALLARGVARNRIVWDYGIGFGKSVPQNFALLARQAELLDLDFPCSPDGPARAHWARSVDCRCSSAWFPASQRPCWP